MQGLAVQFAKRGFSAVTFDMRGVGRSTGSSTYTGLHEVKDVEAVVKWVEREMEHDVILVGSSAGVLRDH
jgi:hypothetical protein